MARTSIAAGGGDLRIYIDARELEKTSAAFKDARRAVTKTTRAIVVDVAEKTVLPSARTYAGTLAVAGSSIASSLVVRRGRRNGAVLTTALRGKKGRAVGLLEYGGVVSAPILPRTKRALSLRGLGVAVAAVDTARTYKGRKFMTRAAENKAGVFAEELRDRLAEVFP